MTRVWTVFLVKVFVEIPTMLTHEVLNLFYYYIITLFFSPVYIILSIRVNCKLLNFLDYLYGLGDASFEEVKKNVQQVVSQNYFLSCKFRINSRI